MGFFEKIRGLDGFGASMNLNYKGNGSYQTLPGAILTVVINTFLMYSLTTKILKLYNMDDPEYMNYETKVNLRDVPRQNLKEK